MIRLWFLCYNLYLSRAVTACFFNRKPVLNFLTQAGDCQLFKACGVDFILILGIKMNGHEILFLAFSKENFSSKDAHCFLYQQRPKFQSFEIALKANEQNHQEDWMLFLI